MIVYWGACYLSMLLAYTLSNTEFTLKNRPIPIASRRAAIIFSGLPLFVVSAIRYNVGTDFAGYSIAYSLIQRGNNQGIEPVYVILNKLVGLLGGNFQWVVVICSALFVYLTVDEIYRISDNIPFSIFLFVGTLQYLYSLTNIRQMVGCAILFFSLRYIEENKIIKFIIGVLIAAGFHFWCLLFLSVVVLRNVKITNKRGLIISIVIIALRIPISLLVRRFVGFTSYASYLGSKWDQNETSYAIMAVQGSILLFSCFFRDDEDYRINLYTNLQFCCFWISVFSGVLPQTYRIQRIFGFSAIVLIPMIMRDMERKQRWLFFTVMVVLFTIYVYISADLHNQLMILPYRTIFDNI